ncbi:hypothetical protein BJX66DRAFT_337118 [Aspergillus keveii]|uniref:Uncharacterized protein n=1 Tax=Aspergillus keveii TaxID=714993 RepID=A0ABR4G8L8_9EURO
MTNLHEDIAARAKHKSRVHSVAKEAVCLVGDVLVPLRGQGPFDLIHENLPSIPLPGDVSLLDGQTSSTYFDCSDSFKIVTAFVFSAFLHLHYICLVQARSFNLLSKGGRGPLHHRRPGPMRYHTPPSGGSRLQRQNHFASWKIQSEPNEVINGYAEAEEKGLGSFYFYRTDILEKLFAGLTPAAAGLRAMQIENELVP